MSFANKIIPRLGQPADNREWYVNAIWTSLNEYMSDIETALTRPQFVITGTTTVPGVPPIPTPIIAPVGMVSNKHIRLSYPEVKSAMWCGDGNLTFPNLFKLFASKLMLNFTNVYSNTIVNGISAFTFDALTPLAFKAIIPITVPFIGAGLTPSGPFTGTVTISFQQVALL